MLVGYEIVLKLVVSIRVVSIGFVVYTFILEVSRTYKQVCLFSINNIVLNH